MTERRFHEESEDFKRGYLEGWNDREDDLILGVQRVAPDGATVTQHSAVGTCPACHGSRRIHIVEGACTPAHDEDCPVCVGREIAPGVRVFVSDIPS